MPVFLAICGLVACAVGGLALYALRSDIQLGIAVTAICAGFILFGLSAVLRHSINVQKDVDWMIKRMRLEEDDR